MKQSTNNKLLRIKSVIELTGLSRSYIYQLCKLGKFPKPIQLVEGGSSVAWLESEVLDFIQDRVHERDHKLSSAK